MTCEEFQRAYLAGEFGAGEVRAGEIWDRDVLAAAEAHLRGCADCQLVAPELDVLRARLGEPAVWETPASELRSHVVSAVVSAAHPTRPSRWSGGRWWMAGGAAALVLAVVATSLVVFHRRADGADWELALYTKAVSPGAVVEVQGWNTDTGTRLRVDVDGLPPAGPHEYYAIWMTSVDGQHVPAGTFTESGRIEAWSGVRRSDFPRIWITLEPDDGDERLTGATVADTPGW